MDVVTVLGTRPEIIKLAGVVRELGADGRVIHTGQHYDPSLSSNFFDELDIGQPSVVLTGIGGATRGRQVGGIIQALSDEFDRRRPDAVIVQGDTNSASAGAQAAHYAGVPVVHVEAGLRSFDRAMPEEINRLVVGAVADVHCAPTQRNADRLRAEGVDDHRIVVTGNTVVEATQRAMMHVSSTSLPVAHAGGFVLATIHRPENVDEPAALRRLLVGLASVGMPIVFPMHPRTAAAIDRFGFQPLIADMQVLPPVDHQTFLRLALDASLIIADSGGIQEECTVIKRPLVVVRRSTERPEAVEAGFAILVGPDVDLAAASRAFLESLAGRDLSVVPSPFGDGTSSVRIAALTRRVASGQPLHGREREAS